MAHPKGIFRRAQRRAWRRSSSDWPLLPALLMAVGIGGAGAFALNETGWAEWLLGERTAVLATYPIQRFGLCSGQTRHNCVVDGDTFWLEGVKIRIADINTPEVSNPQCAEEAALGRLASARLAELLSGAPIALRAADRDEDQYGRKLRIVELEGRSVGQMLVAEGLAHSWRGHRESWC